MTKQNLIWNEHFIVYFTISNKQPTNLNTSLSSRLPTVNDISSDEISKHYAWHNDYHTLTWQAE